MKNNITEKRSFNSDLDAIAIAKGLKRRREDKLNDRFYFGTIFTLVAILTFFTIGSLFISL
jgi:hypothetical protein